MHTEIELLHRTRATDGKPTLLTSSAKWQNWRRRTGVSAQVSLSAHPLRALQSRNQTPLPSMIVSRIENGPRNSVNEKTSN